MIITIARECGSGGHEIGEMLAKHYGIELYDKRRLTAEAGRKGLLHEGGDFFDETPMDSLLYGIAQSYGENDAHCQRPFEMMRQITGKDNFVVIGRCSNFIYRNLPDVTTVFIHASAEKRIDHICGKYNIDAKTAQQTIDEVDEKRIVFHKRYTGEDWGMARYYQLTIDSGLVGFEKSAEIIRNYIESKAAR